MRERGHQNGFKNGGDSQNLVTSDPFVVQTLSSFGKGKNRTELVQSTRLKKKTRANSAVLCSFPPMTEVRSQKDTNNDELAEPNNKSPVKERPFKIFYSIN